MSQKIIINGKKQTFSNLSNVSDLLRDLDLEKKPVVVELNQEALVPRVFSQTAVQEGDTVEIIMIAAGG